MCARVKTILIYPINYSRSIEAKEIKGTDSSTNSIKRTGVQYFPQLELPWKLLIFKNGANTLSNDWQGHSREALYARMLKKDLAYLGGYFCALPWSPKG